MFLLDKLIQCYCLNLVKAGNTPLEKNIKMPRTLCCLWPAGEKLTGAAVRRKRRTITEEEEEDTAVVRVGVCVESGVDVCLSEAELKMFRFSAKCLEEKRVVQKRNKIILEK